MNSSVAGMTPAPTMAMAVSAATLWSSKYASMLRMASGRGRSCTVISVITPSVPSEPTMSLTRS